MNTLPETPEDAKPEDEKSEDATSEPGKSEEKPPKPDPARYGDWTVKGIAVDF